MVGRLVDQSTERRLELPVFDVNGYVARKRPKRLDFLPKVVNTPGVVLDEEVDELDAVELG